MEDEPDKISITICGDGGCGMSPHILANEDFQDLGVLSSGPREGSLSLLNKIEQS